MASRKRSHAGKLEFAEVRKEHQENVSEEISQSNFSTEETENITGLAASLGEVEPDIIINREPLITPPVKAERIIRGARKSFSFSITTTSKQTNISPRVTSPRVAPVSNSSQIISVSKSSDNVVAFRSLEQGPIILKGNSEFFSMTSTSTLLANKISSSFNLSDWISAVLTPTGKLFYVNIPSSEMRIFESSNFTQDPTSDNPLTTSSSSDKDLQIVPKQFAQFPLPFILEESSGSVELSSVPLPNNFVPIHVVRNEETNPKANKQDSTSTSTDETNLPASSQTLEALNLETKRPCRELTQTSTSKTVSVYTMVKQQHHFLEGTLLKLVTQQYSRLAQKVVPTLLNMNAENIIRLLNDKEFLTFAAMKSFSYLMRIKVVHLEFLQLFPLDDQKRMLGDIIQRNVVQFYPADWAVKIRIYLVKKMTPQEIVQMLVNDDLFKRKVQEAHDAVEASTLIAFRPRI